ncbi:MAG: N-acetylglucosamine-6-phosphate deacetylase [Terrimicrobiaceae bacterium]|nr:N-acetylglucosamine-6-phosphate deacetylase [Terrimicrobiaceae bacterium]
MSLRFTNARLCLPDGVIREGGLRVRAGRIAEVGPRVEPEPGEQVIDAGGRLLAPGFIDLHVHGALGRDAMESTPQALETICRYHATGGSTALALTTVCAPWRDIGRALDAVRGWRGSSGATGARLIGMHVEGPYFSPERRGAHRLEFLRVPEPGDIDHWVRYADVITQITLAPELPGMRELIPALVAAGIRVSGGHSDAWDEEARAAFSEGMRQVTHTFNCMSSARRRGPFRVAGLLEAALADPDVICEVIADGAHVSPTLLRMLWHAKGADGIALITDATAGAGLANGAEFLLGDVQCRVGDGVAFTADGAALAGSTCRMIDGIRTLVLAVGMPPGEAVRTATTSPARALGLDKECGSLAPGLRADLVLFDDGFRMWQTWVGGRCVFEGRG